MTIYYVDPINGSDTNSGLSWAAAWRWPPGNGASVVAGDEIRFAKSQKTFTTDGRTLQYDGIFGFNPLAVTGTWTLGSGGGTLSGRKLSFTPATNVPSNTKLMYYSVGYTTYIPSGSMSEVLIAAKGLSTAVSGTYLKVCLCSDTAGNTIVATLNGPTWFNDAIASKTSFVFGPAGAQINFSSIAVYSTGAFTAPSGGAEVEIETMLLRDYPSAAYIRAGSMIAQTTPIPVTSGFDVARTDFYGFPLYMVAGGGGYAVGGTYPYPRIGYPSDSANTSLQSNSAPLDVYAALPFYTDGRYDRSMAYAGSFSSRIKIRGGWDTTTNVQDGYTFLGIQDTCTPLRKGAFVFSSGGSWLDFERFVCTQSHFIYYDYTISAIAGLRFYDCTIGGGAVSGYSQPSFFGAAGVSTPITVDNWYLERCVTNNFFSFANGLSWSAQTTPLRAYTDFSFGSVDLVDCVVQDLGAGWPYINCPTGDISIRTSVSGQTRCLIVSGGDTYWQLPPGATGSIRMTGVAISAKDHYSKGNEAVTQIKGVFTDIRVSSLGPVGDWISNSKDSTRKVRLGNFLQLTLDGYAFSDNNYTGGGSSGAPKSQALILIEDTATFRSLNPGYVYKIGGPVSSYQLRRKTTVYDNTTVLPDGLYILNPPPSLDFNSPAPVRAYSVSTIPNTRSIPSLKVGTWSGQITISNPYASCIHFLAPQYTAGTYWPNIAQASVIGGTGKVSSDGPLGVVRVYGTKMYTTGLYTQYEASAHPVGRGVISYGAEFDGFVYGEPKSVAANDLIQRGLAFGAVGLGKVIPGLYQYDRYQHDSIIAEDSMTLSAPDELTPSIDRYNYPKAGLFIRTASGRHSLVLSGTSYVESSVTINDYGKRTIYLRPDTSIPLGRIDVMGTETLQVTLIVQPITIVTGMYCFLTIPPCAAYSTDILGHSIKRSLNMAGDKETISLVISPQKSGTIYFNFYTSVEMNIFTFDVASI